jgi:hypothetical protein
MRFKVDFTTHLSGATNIINGDVVSLGYTSALVHTTGGHFAVLSGAPTTIVISLTAGTMTGTAYLVEMLQ